VASHTDFRIGEAMNDQLQELLEYVRGLPGELLEYVRSLPGELLTGVATLLLVVVTALLVKATKDLVRATAVLAQSAKEDSWNRKILATADAWMKLREELDLPNLAKATPEEIDAAGKAAIPQLRALEVFSVGIHSGVYDLKTFNRISGNWFLQQFSWIRPYIEKKQKEKPDVYRELVGLEKAIRDMRSKAEAQA
jgi:hypothetical protein